MFHLKSHFKTGKSDNRDIDIDITDFDLGF